MPAVAEGFEQELHVWCKPETKSMSTLYTISVGKHGICIDMPLDEALSAVGAYLEEMAEA